MMSMHSSSSATRVACSFGKTQGRKAFATAGPLVVTSSAGLISHGSYAPSVKASFLPPHSMVLRHCNWAASLVKASFPVVPHVAHPRDDVILHPDNAECKSGMRFNSEVLILLDAELMMTEGSMLRLTTERAMLL